MKFRGRRNEWKIGIVLALGVITSLIRPDGLFIMLLLLAWLAYYGTCLWVKDIEVRDNKIIINRFKRATEIYMHTITGVAFQKRSIIIFKGKSSGVSLFKKQIHKDDLDAFMKVLEPYKV